MRHCLLQSKIASLLGAFMIAITLASPAGAITITFDDVVVPGSNDIISGTRTSVGFDFTSPHWHVVNAPGVGFLAADGSQYAALDSPTLAAPLEMTKSGGGTFSLISFDGAELFVSPPGGFPNAELIRVVGNLFGGGTISNDFALDGVIDGTGGVADFQGFAFGPAWTNLTSVVWDGFLNAGGRASISIDNIVVDAPAGVPEPSTLFAVGVSMGLAALARCRRRQG